MPAGRLALVPNSVVFERRVRKPRVSPTSALLPRGAPRRDGPRYSAAHTDRPAVARQATPDPVRDHQHDEPVCRQDAVVGDHGVCVRERIVSRS